MSASIQYLQPRENPLSGQFYVQLIFQLLAIAVKPHLRITAPYAHPNPSVSMKVRPRSPMKIPTGMYLLFAYVCQGWSDPVGKRRGDGHLGACGHHAAVRVHAMQPSATHCPGEMQAGILVHWYKTLYDTIREE